MVGTVPRRLVVDIETDGDPWGGRLLAFGYGRQREGEYEFASVRPDDIPPDVIEDLRDPGVIKVEHTLYDARWLRLAGWDVRGPIHDTRVMAWNLDETRPSFKLADLAADFLGVTMDKRVTPSGRFRCSDGRVVPLSDAPVDELLAYNKEDVVATYHLYECLVPVQPSYWDTQVELTGIILDMECNGMPVDLDYLDYVYAKLKWDEFVLEKTLREGLPAQFNLESGDQVAAYLFLPEPFEIPARVSVDKPVPDGFVEKKRGKRWIHGYYTVSGRRLPVPAKAYWTSTGRPKVDERTLAALYSDDEWVKAYLEYKHVKKMVVFAQSIAKHEHGGRIYGTYNQAGTVSGRLSSSDPNMQNFPRRGARGAELRKAFRRPDGDLVVADFSQLEPRLMAHWSGDPELVHIYNEGLDIYKRVGSFVFGVPEDEVVGSLRDVAKQLVLSMGYGAQGKKLAENLTLGGIRTTPREAQSYLESVQSLFGRFFEWKTEVSERARRTGVVYTLAGRPRRVSDGSDFSWRQERQAVNSIIQGSAADVVNMTMLAIHETLPDVRLLAQVHDELVMECDGEPPLDQIKEAGEVGHGFDLAVPLVFEPVVVSTWGDK